MPDRRYRVLAEKFSLNAKRFPMPTSLAFSPLRLSIMKRPTTWTLFFASFWTGKYIM